MRVSIKKILNNLFLLSLFLISYTVYSQFYHGVELGASLTSADFKINESAEPSSGLGFSIGYLAEREFSDNLYIRLAVNFNRREFKAINIRGINTSEEEWKIDVIEIPINLGYYINWNNRNFQFFVDAGLNLGYNSRVTLKNNIETIRLDIGNDAEIKRITVGANVSIGLLIKKRVKVRLNYYNSLSNITNSDGNMWKNRTLGISINYFLRDKQVY